MCMMMPVHFFYFFIFFLVVIIPVITVEIIGLKTMLKSSTCYFCFILCSIMFAPIPDLIGSFILYRYIPCKSFNSQYFVILVYLFIQVFIPDELVSSMLNKILWSLLLIISLEKVFSAS